MEKKLFLTMVAAAFMLASCGNEVKESWNGEIRLRVASRRKHARRTVWTKF